MLSRYLLRFGALGYLALLLLVPLGMVFYRAFEHGFWPDDRQIVIDEGRLRPGVTDVMALRVGYEKLNRETGWEPLVSWEEGVLRTIQWYAEHRERWIGRVDWLRPVGTQATSAPAP